MTGIDTNILVRFLVGDDPAQAERARRFLAESRAKGERVHVSVLVLCEAAWVLRSTFARPKGAALDALEQVLHTDVFQVEADEAVGRAVEACRRGPGDFADHLIAQLNEAHGCRQTVTFDRALRRVPGFTVL
jgi:predicted nucleic-acid-binding protein